MTILFTFKRSNSNNYFFNLSDIIFLDKTTEGIPEAVSTDDGGGQG